MEASLFYIWNDDRCAWYSDAGDWDPHITGAREYHDPYTAQAALEALPRNDATYVLGWMQ